MMKAVDLDADHCYEAVRARDRRFDGAFFTAVTTTGVYCRPVCPSRLPRRRNVRFFAHAAAAEGAGFRPCRRCRPESAPATPTWLHGDDVLRRALGLIDDGVLDGGSVVDLARRLHMADRNLRRIFAEQLGTNPVAVARTRRAHLARRLLDETSLPVTDVAFAAGFGSVRQFNDVMRVTYGAAPTDLRHRAPNPPVKGWPDGLASVAPLSLRLPFRAPLDWEATLHVLTVKTTPGVEQVIVGTAGPGSAYCRSTPGGWVQLRSGGDDHLVLDVAVTDIRDLAGIVARARRMFDLDADTESVGMLLRQDALLAPIVDRHPGLRLLGAWDGFEGAVRIIVGQLVSVRAASTTTGRLCRTYGTPVDTGHDGLGVLFPAPAALVDEELEAVGMTRAKAGAIRSLAAAVLAGDVSLDGSMPPDRLEAALLSLPGVGPWTAAMVRMRIGRDPDAFVPGDLGVRRALGDISAAAAEERSQAWRPWRAYAAMYLWRSIT
jgi:AraC family transcriptional regulator, regulatory protein of adaptative response / DNA-3-methyladenine glycosylase II